MATIRETPDELWKEIQKLIPPRPDRSKGGLKPAYDRMLFNGMIFILRKCVAWRDMPEKHGTCSTVYDRFREWRNAQVFEQLRAKCLHYYEEKYGIICEWQSSECTHVRAPLGEKRTVPTPPTEPSPE